MSYHLYSTEAVVLKSWNFGEHNELLALFTKEFGLISVFAKSIKKHTSKLRPSLQPFSWLKISLIKGKGGFKITGVEERLNAYYLLREDNKKIYTLARIYSLLLRLLQGEERDYKLYEIIKNQVDYLKEHKISETDLKSFEALAVSGIMSRLGYLGDDDDISSFLNTGDLSEEKIKNFSKYSKKSIKMVNEALEESHL